MHLSLLSIITSYSERQWNCTCYPPPPQFQSEFHQINQITITNRFSSITINGNSIQNMPDWREIQFKRAESKKTRFNRAEIDKKKISIQAPATFPVNRFATSSACDNQHAAYHPTTTSTTPTTTTTTSKLRSRRSNSHTFAYDYTANTCTNRPNNRPITTLHKRPTAKKPPPSPV